MFNNVRISGATSNNLTIANAQTNDTASYTLLVSNAVAVATSAVARLTVLVPPSITTQPAGFELFTGTNVIFKVKASGSPQLRYVWQKDGLNLVDSTNVLGSDTPSLSLLNLQTNDSGGYRVLVANDAGSATSAVAVLSVTVAPVPPTIVTQPVSQITPLGSNVTFSVTAAGTLPLSYQWLKDSTTLADGGPVSGATSPALTLSGVLSSDEGNYQVIVTNAGGAVTSAIVTLAVAQTVPVGADAVVLVNSTSANYLDFQRFIQPYLDNFGVPYTVRDIATNSVGTNLGRTALIIIGHKQIDTNQVFLDSAAQANISAAISNGVGLLNFDSDLSVGATPRYQFIQTVFGFAYGTNGSGTNITLPPTEPGPQMHFITSLHTNNEIVHLRTNMALPGLILPTNATALALNGGKPLLAMKKYGAGRALQWASYDWAGTAVLGPISGLDDLLWRGIVWSARKPFVTRSIPNFVTVRMDDCAGPFDWVHIFNNFGFKPFVSVFVSSVSAASAADLRSLATNGNATVSPHAWSGLNLIFAAHPGGQNYPDNVASNYLNSARQWHVTNGIPMCKTIAAHYSEIGWNTLQGLLNWGIEYLPLEVDVGVAEYSAPYPPWLIGGPYRLYESPGLGLSSNSLYYADFLNVAGHPEFNGKFFNCYSEVRDATLCGQWCPNNSISDSVNQGMAMLKRSFDSRVLASLFSHEFEINGNISITNFWLMVQGLATNLVPYQPLYVQADYGYQYARALRTSRLLSCTFDLASGQLSADWSGKADLATQVQVYTNETAANLVATVSGFTNSYSSVLAMLPSAPVIFGQPLNYTNNAGTTAVLRAGTAGPAPLSYQWFFNGTNLLSDGPRINGAKSWALTIADVRGPDAGLYNLVVSNVSGVVTSAPAILSVIEPVVALLPANQTNDAGQTALFHAEIVGSAPIAYQWLRDGGAAIVEGGKISGANSATLTIADVMGGDSGNYSLLASNSYGSVTTTPPALLTVIDPILLTQPLSTTNHEGAPVSFSVQAYGTSPAFQWVKDSMLLDEATNSSLFLPAVSPDDAGSYAVLVSNSYGSLVSATATLSVVGPLRIESVSANDGSVAITWSAVPGNTYSVQQKSAVDETNWIDIAPPVTADGFSASATNSITDPQGYYRVHLLP